MKNRNKIFDGLLVLQYRSGNKKALGLLVNRYHRRLYEHSYRYTHDFDASKDIAQDCWSVIITKLDDLKNPNLFGSWALRIATRKSLDYVKNRKRNLNKLHEYYNISSVKEGQENWETETLKLLKAMSTLPENQQIVLRLFYKEDYSLKEISDILEISIGTVKSRLFHAREKLKTILK
jgi:RNA polymerase sigma-70 factor (ECF subfamily)